MTDMGVIAQHVVAPLVAMVAGHRNHDIDTGPRWWEVSASIGHLVIAVVSVIVVIAAAIFNYVWDNHKAITLLQERQAVVYKYMSEDVQDRVERERQLKASLSELNHSIEELKMEVVRHVAIEQGANGVKNSKK